MVLQVEGQPASLCLGAVAASLPPQCGDVPIVGWSWAEVSGEDHAGGVTWGDYHVEGTYDGASFTVTSAGSRPAAPPEEGDPFATPCEVPAEGWVSGNPSMISESDRIRAQRVTEDQIDFAGIWIDYVDSEPDPEDPGRYVLNIAFTADAGSHEAELRSVWGGALCIVRFDRTERELQRIQEELAGPEVEGFGLTVLWSDTDVMRNQVEIGVVTSTPGVLAALEATYGVGAVSVTPALRPIP